MLEMMAFKVDRFKILGIKNKTEQIAVGFLAQDDGFVCDGGVEEALNEVLKGGTPDLQETMDTATAKRESLDIDDFETDESFDFAARYWDKVLRRVRLAKAVVNFRQGGLEDELVETILWNVRSI